MRIDYPNDFDIKKGIIDKRKKLGNNIFIHGGKATIGCIPIGNDKIEELFYIFAKNGIDKSNVIISPYDMRSKNLKIDIPNITWEEELYAKIKLALKPFNRK